MAESNEIRYEIKADVSGSQKVKGLTAEFKEQKDAVEGVFRVDGAPPPDHPVLHDGVKGGLFPVFLLHRHHVIVGHENGRLAL